MKISYTWLKYFIDNDLSPEKTGELLTNLGLEVEGIEDYESIKGGLEGIVVGKIMSCEKHPNADRLQITSVDVGNASPLTIICGAPNVTEGQNVAVAQVGTTLYDEENGPLKIKATKIRGEESRGMICSERELGLGESHEGIMVLDNELQPGKPLAEIFNILSDKVFEIGLTPNRSDAMSHYGVARDLRAGLIQQGNKKPLNTPSVSKFKVDDHRYQIPVVIEDSKKALRYCALTISDIEVKDAPLWLQNRLKAIGVEPINNVVDATNYVMHELGQPFHAFDADRISGQKITVKTLEEGTKFTTLDGVERVLSAEDLMVCDDKKPLCIAGVYGGESSGVVNETTKVFLESAYFDPVSVRKTAKRHGLTTDASFRFERGIDPEMTDFALKRLTLLIQEIAGGKVSSNLDDFYGNRIDEKQVFLRYDKIEKLIGQKISENDLKIILASLDIQVKNVTETGMGLNIPPYRNDVTREVDVIEEILRVYGYNRIEFDEHNLNASIAVSDKYADDNMQNIVADQLIGQGFYEAMSNSLTDENHVRAQEKSKNQNVHLLNPLSQDLAVLRQSLISGGLESIAFNLNRKNKNLRFFEFGKTYHNLGADHKEIKHFSLFVTGEQQRENWNSDTRKNDFFFMRGVLDAVFERVGIEVEFQAHSSNLYSESLELHHNKKPLGHFGVLNKEITQKYDVDQEVLFADILWGTVLKILSSKPKIKLQPIAKFPKTRRDFALLIDDEVSFAQIEKMAFETEKKILKDVGLFDVYKGDKLPESKKSYAVSFTFLDEKKTLTDKRVDKVMKKLRNRFEKELHAELR